MEKHTVRKFYLFGLGVFLCVLLVGFAQGETFQLLSGGPPRGEAISPDNKGVIIRLEDGKTSDRIAWEKFTQEDLKKIAASPKIAQNPKTVALVEQYIEPSEEEKAAAKAPLEIKHDYPKLEHPPK